MMRPWAALSQSCRLIFAASAAFASQTQKESRSACEEVSEKAFLSEWRKDVSLRRELERLMPSDRAQSKNQLEQALKHLDHKVSKEVDEPDVTMWAVDLGGHTYVNVALQHGQLVKLTARYAIPPGFAKADALLFVNEWNTGKNFARANVLDNEVYLQMDLHIGWISDRIADKFNEFFSLFATLAMLFGLELLNAALSDGSDAEKQSGSLRAAELRSV